METSKQYSRVYVAPVLFGDVPQCLTHSDPVNKGGSSHSWTATWFLVHPSGDILCIHSISISTVWNLNTTLDHLLFSLLLSPHTLAGGRVGGRDGTVSVSAGHYKQ